MAELWLPAEDRLAVWEPVGDQVRVIGWRPGPAGVSAVEVHEGLIVVVDHASPTTLAEVTVDLVDGHVVDAHLPLLSSLLGDEATELLRRLPGSRGGRPTSLPRARDDDRELARIDPAGRAGAAFPTVTIAADLGDDGRLAEAARAVAWLEAAAGARELGLHGLAALFGARSVDLLETSAPTFDPKFAARVAALAGRVGLAVDQILAARLRRATDRLAAEPAFAAAAMAAPLAAPRADRQRSAATVEEPQETTPRAIPLRVEGEVGAWAGLTDAGHVVVTAGHRAEGAWARVFRRADRVLLGLAPLRAAPPSAQLDATIVVPRTPPHDLVVDVVTDPASPRRHATHDGVREAVLAGRRAARRSRLGDPAADAAWSATAARWRVLGDTQRANLADRHGRRDERRPRGSGRFADLPRLLSDEIGPSTR